MRNDATKTLAIITSELFKTVIFSPSTAEKAVRVWIFQEIYLSAAVKQSLSIGAQILERSILRSEMSVQKNDLSSDKMMNR